MQRYDEKLLIPNHDGKTKHYNLFILYYSAAPMLGSLAF